jgi:hypothetical protein
VEIVELLRLLAMGILFLPLPAPNFAQFFLKNKIMKLVPYLSYLRPLKQHNKKRLNKIGTSLKLVK